MDGIKIEETLKELENNLIAEAKKKYLKKKTDLEFFVKLRDLFKEYKVDYFGSCGCCNGTSVNLNNDYDVS